VGIGVADDFIVGFRIVSLVLVGTGVLVDGAADGKGVNGMVAEGLDAATAGEVGCTPLEELTIQPERKITNKVNITILDEYNLIMRPFIMHRDSVLMLEYRPKIIVYWICFGNNIE
jgi:hypothetical protein